MSERKLSKIISAKDDFLDINWSQIRKMAAGLTRKLHTTKNPNLNIDVKQIENELKNIEQSYFNIRNYARGVVDEFDDLIKDIEKDYLMDSYKTYEDYYEFGDADETRYQNDQYDTRKHGKELAAKIKPYVDWTYPGLQLNPSMEDWTRQLVGCDPLYIVDRHEDLLDEVMDKFNEKYQRRMRPYVIQEDDFSELPQEQFGFIFGLNYFEFKPYSVQVELFKKLYQLLRPGGVIAFSYNNCEIQGSCILAEQNVKCYMTKTRLKSLTDGLGFNIIELVDHYPNFSYAILQKPGKLQHNRAGQTLAKIQKNLEN